MSPYCRVVWLQREVLQLPCMEGFEFCVKCHCDVQSANWSK